MKARIMFFAALLTAVVSCSVQGDKFEALQSEFANPGKEYRAAPLWVWNTEMTTEDIDCMLTDFKEQGFGGAFVHPRPGLETEYLSDRWFELWRYSVEKGKQLGLDIWIYDENSYPSGFAGGHVPAQMPESYNQGRALLCTKTDSIPDSCFMCLLKDGDKFTDITNSIASYKGKQGQYYVYNKSFAGASSWTGGFPYVDLLVKGVTEKFIEVTMSGYEKTFGEELGTVVKGTFTDEPNINTNTSGRRWTPDLFEVFQQMWGYDLQTNWSLLDEEIGNWKKVRHDYNATLLRMFIDRWSKPWYEYTESKKMIWTGHYWEHGWPELQEGPDNMAMYAWHQMPAIDMLFNNFDDKSPMAQFGNVRSVKELRSVANQMGRKRTLSETYGGAGANLRFVDMKRLGDWEYALGVNFMNQHLCHTTITGVRKYDYPPEFTAISPWWEDYHVLNDYFGRLSLVLSHGEQINDWLVLEPTTSLWLYGNGPKLHEIGNAFQAFITDMEKNQVEFDLGCEDIMRDHGSVSSKGLTVGERTYSTVIIPPMMENLEQSTFDLLKQFAEKGGRLLSLSSPSLVSGDKMTEAIPFTKVTEKEVIDLYVNPLKMSKGIGLYHQHRVYGDGDLYFFVNSSLEQDMPLAFETESDLYELDPMTGKIFSVESPINTILSPAGSKMYFISSSATLTADQKPSCNSSDTLQCGELSVSRTKPNALSVDFCNLTVDGKQTNNLYVKEANKLMWAHFGMVDPWESAVQYKRTILEGDTLPHSNIMVEYYFNIEGEVDFESMHMTIERPDIWNVALNGRPISWEMDTLFDRRCGVFEMARALHKGRNCITIQRDIMSIHAELAPVIITGNFDVKPTSRGWKIVPSKELSLGNMTQQGAPEYPWTVSYSKTCTVDSPTGRFILQLGNWNGTEAYVMVNGKKAGNVSFPPYKLDITPFIFDGDNRVEVCVTGTLRNLYGPHFNSDLTITHPGSWNGQYKPCSGEKYFTLPYGLEEDYCIINLK